MRRNWLGPETAMSVVRQCELLGVSRSTFYARRQVATTEDELDFVLLRLIDEEYTRHPFYGSRRMVVFLKRKGYPVNRKRMQRLMRKLGLAGMAPGPNTSRAHPEHTVYPYLLRGVEIVRPNQVWSTDITYIRLERGFGYLVAVMDWYSRKLLSWRVSNTLDAGFCVNCLETALRGYGAPNIFNTDQGSQFTSKGFTGILKEHGVLISMDGRGRALDNIFVERLWRTVKYEDVYIRGYDDLSALEVGLGQYFDFYNGERPHQAMKNRTPNEVYETGSGGGARITA